MILKRWKEEKQIAIKHRAKIYTEVLYFALNSWRECYWQRNGMKSGARRKVNFFKMNEWGDPNKLWGLEKNRKINKREDVYLFGT